MSTQTRLLAALGAAVGALVFAVTVSTAFASADDCASGECSLGLGGDPTDVGYLGFRPFATDWWGNQPVDVVTQDGGTLGTYNVFEQDFLSPIFDASLYHYGDFTPAGDSTGDDPYGLSGMWLYDVGFGPGLGGPDAAEDASGQSVLMHSLTGLGPDGTYYWVVTGPSGIQNTLQVSPTALFGSSDYITIPGQDQPIMLWDELPHTVLGPADVSSMLPPDDLITWP
jgi:hypothetical protein